MNTTFIVFGITGDLSKRKLIPGLYQLIKDKKLNNFAIIGVGLEDKKNDDILNPSKEFVHDLDKDIWQHFVSHFFYLKNDVRDEHDFQKLKELILEKIKTSARTKF